MMQTSSQIPREVDCLVLGGGITGAGVARDAAIRGLSVLLVDSHDFASGTSHLTSKLVHGGLRYLEYGQFRMVLEGVSERNRLLNLIAPNLVRPLKFIIPLEEHDLKRWLLATSALQLYDLMGLYDGGRRSRTLNEAALAEACPALRSFPSALAFWDAQTNDARLVLATLRTAVEAGATILNYAAVQAARFDGRGWDVHLCDEDAGVTVAVQARSIVNATGPWAPLTAELLSEPPKPLMWVKGTHIVLDRLAGFGDDAIVIRSLRDRRPLWVVPWESRLLMGTTESFYEGNLRRVRAEEDEVADLFSSFADAFPGLHARPHHVRMAFAGVRPIIQQEGALDNALSRHHEIDTDAARRVITISGGKLTTFRRMAEQAVDQVVTMLSLPPISRRTRQRLRGEALWPGLVRGGRGDLHHQLAREARSAELDEETITHVIRHYGVDAAGIVARMFRDRTSAEPLVDGLPFTLAEVDYLCRAESVRHLEDLVRRRTPLYFLADIEDGRVLRRIAAHIAPMMAWDAGECDRQVGRVLEDLAADLSAVRDFQRQAAGVMAARGAWTSAAPASAS